MAALRRFFGFGAYPSSCRLSSVQIHDIETSTDRTDRKLKHLIKANHANHSILYHGLRYHNHMPHFLGSARLLGATPDHLVKIYDEESRSLEAWTDAPAELNENDWYFHLGKKEYQRAFIDFFEDKLVDMSYDWQSLVRHFLTQGERPLINNLVSGLAHPLIHIGYAFELDSATLAIESLALACCCHDFFGKYMEDPQFIRQSNLQTSGSPETLLLLLYQDDQIAGSTKGMDMAKLFKEYEARILDYWNALDLVDLTNTLEEIQMAAVRLLLSSCGATANYSFFLVHVLTSSHAVRVLFPFLGRAHQTVLLQQWWLFTIGAYLVVGRPKIDNMDIENYDVDGIEWKHVAQRSLDGPHALDAHYVKAIRSFQEAEKTWGSQAGFYLKAAVRFSNNFQGWYL